MPTNYFVRKFCYNSLVAVELEPKQVSKIALFFFRLVIKRKTKQTKQNHYITPKQLQIDRPVKNRWRNGNGSLRLWNESALHNLKKKKKKKNPQQNSPFDKTYQKVKK